jgi:hypothetical protein
MGHTTLTETNNDQSAEPKVPTGLGWSEFFHELGVGTQGVGGSPDKGTEQALERTLYASENGDRWSLVRDADTERVFVRHRPNLASGGQTSDTDVGEFLVRSGLGPEKQELLRLIGSIAEGPEGSA